ncbi:hypothetical protein [Lacinutrix chionoecetis]
MRRLIIITSLLLFISCEISSPKSVAISVLADRTEDIIPSPSIKDIQSLMDLKAEPNSGVTITFQNIGNVDYSTSYKLELEASSILGNTIERGGAIELFYSRLDSLIIRENKQKYAFQSSNILYPLMMEFNTLSKTTHSEKEVLLYSDLNEFSDVFNVYDYESLIRLQNHPSEVAMLLKSQLDIPDLKGITLYIIYYPKTSEANRLFRNMVQVYRELFKDSGLTIEIGLVKQLKL